MKKDNKLKKNLATLGLGVMMSFGVVGIAACGEPPVQYKVSFDTDGGTTYNQITANVGDKINLPTPEREGYVFGGWFLNEECSGEAVTGLYTVTAETTLYAKWTAIQGTITFESNGGTAYNPVTVSGKAVDLPVPEKADHVFEGWYANADFSGDALSGKYVPNGNVTLYAKWTYRHIVVSFDSKQGTTHENMVFVDEALTLPTPFRYGYAFEGWYDNADYNGEAVESVYTPSANVTLHAKWSKVTYVYMYYTETFDHKRFEFKEGDTITVSQLNELFRPDPIVGEDIFGNEYSAPFAFWMHEGETEDTHTQVTDTITVGSEHIILLAQYDRSNAPGKANIKYDEKTDSFTMTGNTSYEVFDEGTPYGTISFALEFTKGAGGGVGPAFRMRMTNVDYHHQQGKYISTNLVPATGKLQVCRVDNGFAHLPGSNGAATMPTEWATYYDAAASGSRLKVTMSVVVTETDFEVYYSNLGGNTSAPFLVYRFSDVDSSTASQHYPNLMSEYVDTGVGIRSTGNVNNVISNISYTPAYKVTFDQAYAADEAKVVDKNTALLVTAEDSDVLFDDENDKNTAYYNKFVGWSLTDGGAPITEFTPVNKLYAVYERVNLHTITFDKANGEAATYTYVKDGELLVLPTEEPFKNGQTVGGALKGYTFNEWQVNGVAAVAGTPITADTSVVATYNEHNAYTVSFVAEGVTIEDVIVAEGEKVNLPTPERENYRFDGWYTDSAFENAYENTGVSANDTLYGKWVERVTVTFVSNGAQVSSQTVDKGSTVDIPTNPTKAAETKTNGNILTYTFSKWTANSAEVTAATVFNSSTTVEAEFACVETRNGAIVTYDEDGDVIYTIDKDRNASANSDTAVTGQGFTFDGYAQELTTNGAEVSYNLTVGHLKTSTTTNTTTHIRMMILTDDGTADENDMVNVLGTGQQATVWLDFNTRLGQLIFGSKIKGTSKNNWSITNFSSAWLDQTSKYVSFWNALAAGDSGTLEMKFQYGLNANGYTWIKIYLFNELTFAYGLAESTTKAGYIVNQFGEEEKVFGKICTEANHNYTSKTDTDNDGIIEDMEAFYYYIGSEELSVKGNITGTDIGIWSYGGEVINGGYTVSNIVSKQLTANS